MDQLSTYGRIDGPAEYIWNPAVAEGGDGEVLGEVQPIGVVLELAYIRHSGPKSDVCKTVRTRIRHI